MKITLKHLQQIIKEELMREMSMHTGAPPNLRSADDADAALGEMCGTCVHFCPDTQTCMAFGDYPVRAAMVCDAWTSES